MRPYTVRPANFMMRIHQILGTELVTKERTFDIDGPSGAMRQGKGSRKVYRRRGSAEFNAEPLVRTFGTGHGYNGDVYHSVKKKMSTATDEVELRRRSYRSTTLDEKLLV